MHKEFLKQPRLLFSSYLLNMLLYTVQHMSLQNIEEIFRANSTWLLTFLDVRIGAIHFSTVT